MMHMLLTKKFGYAGEGKVDISYITRIEPWLDWKFVEVNFYLTQMITEHGCFKKTSTGKNVAILHTVHPVQELHKTQSTFLFVFSLLREILWNVFHIHSSWVYYQYDAADMGLIKECRYIISIISQLLPSILQSLF